MCNVIAPFPVDVQWQFLSRDMGEEDTNTDPSWIEDEGVACVRACIPWCINLSDHSCIQCNTIHLIASV